MNADQHLLKLRSLVRPLFAWLATVMLALATLLPQPTIAQANSACAEDIFVQPGDSLSSIAARLLDSPSAYPRIVAATNDAAALDDSYATIVDPAIISVGWKLCLPADQASVQPSEEAEENSSSAESAATTPAGSSSICAAGTGCRA